MASVIALYGNEKLERVFCPDCGSYSFVIRGIKKCCGSPVETKPDKYFRMSDAAIGRKLPSRKEQARILEEQEGRCIYCGVKFGELITRKDKSVLVRVEWDHRLPYALTLNNKAANFVAACQVCNGIKSDKVFDLLVDAQSYILKVREKKGYKIE